MATAAAISAPELPVPVLKFPHWRVNFRPDSYEPEATPSLAKCRELVEQTAVRLRGLDFPHLSSDPTEVEYGPNWFASWTNWTYEIEHYWIEYWRLYQSGQFLHLHAFEEAINPDLKKKLEEATKSHLKHARIDWTPIRGYVSILNFFYTVTEIFEFAARLCQRGLYKNRLTITIELKRIKGFVLTTDWNRSWMRYCPATQDVIPGSWTYDTSLLVSESADQSLKAAVWFFERFGWLNPSLDLLRREQQTFLEGKL